MLNFNLFEKLELTFQCFGRPKTKDSEKKCEDDLHKNIYNVTPEYKVSILPIQAHFDIENLYPTTDQVHIWNIFVVGSDKTYIVANINDEHVSIPNAGNLPNNQGPRMLPNELVMVFDNIWTKTLAGSKLQFYMVWNGKLYLINTYPLSNNKNKVIGAILFMRGFDTVPESKPYENHSIPIKSPSEERRSDFRSSIDIM